MLSIEEKLWDRFFYWRVAGVHPAQVLWAEKSVEIASLTGQAPTLPATIPTGPLAEAERQLRERAPAKATRKERAKATVKEKPAKVEAKEKSSEDSDEE